MLSAGAGFVSFNEETEQYLCAAVLRPGNVTAAMGAVGLLRRLVKIIRNRFPGVQIRVRLDARTLRLYVWSMIRPGNPEPSRASSPSVKWPSRPVPRLRHEASPKPFAQRLNRNQINHIYYQWFKLTLGSKTDRLTSRYCNRWFIIILCSCIMNIDSYLNIVHLLHAFMFHVRHNKVNNTCETQ